MVASVASGAMVGCSDFGDHQTSHRSLVFRPLLLSERKAICDRVTEGPNYPTEKAKAQESRQRHASGHGGEIRGNRPRQIQIMTADEQSRLKEELIAERDRQAASVKASQQQ